MTDTTTVIEQFNEAFRLQEPERLVDIIADDCVMEGVGPAPDGNRWTGYHECDRRGHLRGEADPPRLA